MAPNRRTGKNIEKTAASKKQKTGKGTGGPSSRQNDAHDGILGRLNEADRSYFLTLLPMKAFPEKGVALGQVDDFPALRHIFKRETWANYFSGDFVFDLDVVREFYATVSTNRRGALVGRVQGIEISITPDVLNQAFGLLELPRHSAEFVDDFEEFLSRPLTEKLELMRSRFVQPGRILAAGQLTTILSTEAKMLYRIVCECLTPTQSNRRIQLSRLALVYSMMEDHSINIGNLIFKELDRLTKRRNLKSLFFPVAISVVCACNGIELVDATGGEWIGFKPHDLMRIRGYDHPLAGREGDDDLDAQADHEEQHAAPDEAHLQPPPTDFDSRLDQMHALITANHAAQMAYLTQMRDDQLAYLTQLRDEQLAHQMARDELEANRWNAYNRRMDDFERRFANWPGVQDPPPPEDD